MAATTHFERNITEASYLVTFSLPTTILAAAAVTSSGINVGTDAYHQENVEVSLDIPALSATIAPAAATTGFTFIIEESASSTFNGTTTLYQTTIAGSASGIAAKDLRVRLPSDSLQYLRAKVYMCTTCTDASAVTGTLALKF